MRLVAIISASFGVSFLVAPWVFMLIAAPLDVPVNMRLIAHMHSTARWIGLWAWISVGWLVWQNTKTDNRQRVFTFIVWLTGGGLLTFWWLAYLLCIDRALWEPGDLRPSFEQYQKLYSLRGEDIFYMLDGWTKLIGLRVIWGDPYSGWIQGSWQNHLSIVGWLVFVALFIGAMGWSLSRLGAYWFPHRVSWVFWRAVKGFVCWMGWQGIYLTHPWVELGNLTVLARFFQLIWIGLLDTVVWLPFAIIACVFYRWIGQVNSETI